jgi:hypothetical protein
MFRYSAISCLSVLVLILSACQSSPSKSGAQGGLPGKSEVSQTAKANDPVYPKELKKEKCNLLQLDDVVSTIGVSAENIEEKLSGCLYSWESEGQSGGSLYLMSLRVFETVDKAQRRYSNRTRNVTAAEQAKAMEGIKKRTAERLAKNEKTKSASNIATSILDSLPKEDYTHTPLDGIASEAALSSTGALNIRSGNLVLTVQGSGKGEEKLDAALMEKVGKRIVENLSKYQG